VDEVDGRARKAYDAHDGTAWRRCFNEVQALLETAWQEEFSAMRLDDPTYVQKRVARVVNWAHRVEHELADQSLTSEGDLRKLQEAEMSRIRAWYEADVKRALADLEKSEGDPDAVRKKADAVGSELERIEAALERVPQIGMVTDRGGAGGAA
jgi:molecular chaperone DnaK